MPDDAGKLTDDEKKKVVAWLAKTSWGQRAGCPICGDTNWIIGDHIVQPVTLGGKGSLLLGGIGYPQIMLISGKCGYTIFLNAVVAGILAGNPEGTPP